MHRIRTPCCVGRADCEKMLWTVAAALQILVTNGQIRDCISNSFVPRIWETGSATATVHAMISQSARPTQHSVSTSCKKLYSDCGSTTAVGGKVVYSVMNAKTPICGTISLSKVTKRSGNSTPIRNGLTFEKCHTLSTDFAALRSFSSTSVFVPIPSCGHKRIRR